MPYLGAAMPLDATHPCPFCEDVYHRRKGLYDHIRRVHPDNYPAYTNSAAPQELLDPSSDQPDQDSTSVFDQENLRYALWQAFLSYRFSGVHLQHEDLRILDSLAALARSWKGP